MTRLAVAAAALALALATFFVFPGHTWLQQDSQIWTPMLEHLRDPAVLRNDILVQQPHVGFTLYDEVSRTLRGLTGEPKVEVLDENRTLNTRNDIFRDDYQPWDAHVYRIATARGH